jgi:predicted NAD/FAD-binding protein
VFNDRNYPSFVALLDRLGVGSQPSEMSFGVSDERGDFEYSGSSPNGLFAKRSHLVTPWFHRMIADLVRFNRAARTLLRGEAEGPSLGDWLEAQRFSGPFIDRLIVPQASAVWSADPRQMWSFPARFLVEFFDNHGMLGFRQRPQWRTISGGSARYVEALLAAFEGRLRLNTRVTTVSRGPEGVLLTPRGGAAETFDEVVLATHSDQALAILSDASDLERDVLGAIPYQTNEAVLHTDTGLLPRRRRAWASWNYHLLEQPEARATVTYDMNRLQSLRSTSQLCVTLNRTEAIRPDRIIRTIPYAHPVFTSAGNAAQARAREVTGRNRTHFCGAYWGWGFHEDGVVSALRVAQAFGAQL